MIYITNVNRWFYHKGWTFKMSMCKKLLYIYLFHVGHTYLFMWITCRVYFHILHVNYWRINVCLVFSPNNFQTFFFVSVTGKIW
jgi:hypothetical protein